LMPLGVCEQKLGTGHISNYGAGSDRNICIQDTKYKGVQRELYAICEGDSGSPMILPNRNAHGKFVAVGLVSWHKQGCDPEGPTYGTKLETYFCGWVSNQMKMHCQNDPTVITPEPTPPDDDDDGCYCGAYGYGSGSGGLYQIINVNSNEYGSSKSAEKSPPIMEGDGRRRLLDEDDENTGKGDGRGAASKGGSDTKGNGNFVVMGDHNIINYNTGDVGGSAGLSPCICGDDSYGSGTGVGSDGRPGSPGVAPKGKKNKNNSTKTTNTTKTCRCACTCPDGRTGYRPGAVDGRPG